MVYEFTIDSQQINGILENFKKHPQEIQKQRTFRLPTTGIRKVSEQTRKNKYGYGQGDFYQSFPGDLHQRGHVQSFVYRSDAFKYGFYHSIVDQYIWMETYATNISKFFVLYDRSAILQILGSAYIQKKIQDEKSRYHNKETENLEYLLTFLINCLLVVYSRDGRFFSRDDRIVIQQYNKQSIFRYRSDQHYDPIVYALASIKQDFFDSQSTVYQYPRQLWSNFDSLSITERLQILFTNIIYTYDLYHLSNVFNLIIFSLKITL